jgi:YbbR domain-containing protein
MEGWLDMENWLRNTTIVRIAAVILAILLWVVVHLDEQAPPVPTSPQTQTRSISDVQITMVGLNEEKYNIQSIEPSNVNIVLKGKESAVNQISPKDRIQLDLSGISEPGQHTLPLSAVDFPTGVQVDIYPPSVTVNVEEIQNKEVPVVIELIGEPAEGYRVGTPILNPSRAIVSVTSSSLDQIVAVQGVVDITNAQEAVVESEKLIAIDADGQEVEAAISPAVVSVEIPITSPFKTVPLQINLINQSEAGFSIASFKQSASEVTIYGPENILAKIDIYKDIEIDLSGLKSSQKYSLLLPIDQGMHQIFPESVEVEIEIVPSTTVTLEDIPIIISGANDEYNTRFLEPESGLTDVIIEGAPNVLKTANSTNVQAIVDVSNLPPGIHEQTVKLNLPRFVKYGGTEEITARVEIQLQSEAEEVINDDPPEEVTEEPSNSNE